MTGSMGSGPLILIVEDDPFLVKLLEVYLESLGYRTLLATDGGPVADMARDSVPDLIVLDISLPRVDGWEVLRRLRQDPALDKIPILVLTALDKELVLPRLREAGISEVLFKPFDPQVLKDWLERLLKRPPRQMGQ